MSTNAKTTYHHASGNDRLTVEQRREVKRDVESAKVFQHRRRVRSVILKAIRGDVFAPRVTTDPADRISAKSRMMAQKLSRFAGSKVR